MRLQNIVISAVVALTSCSDSQSPSSSYTVKGVGIVDHISQSTDDGLPYINVWPVKGTPLSAITHLGLFEDFAPGLTFEEARKRYGEPATTRTLVNETELRCYRRDTATLAVGRERYFSDPSKTVFWTSWAFPVEGGFSLNSLVTSNVLDQIHSPSPPFYLVIRDSTPSEESLWLRVDLLGVTEVRWISSESWKKRKD